MIDIKTNLAVINAQIQQLMEKNARAISLPTVIAVSKKQSVEAIQQAAAVGQRHFGENYLQEAVEKITKINDKSLSWHFIGTIQSNKTQAIAQHFQWVHTIDRIKIAQRLSAQRPEQLPPLNVCIQVNIDADKAKAGVETENCLVLARQIDQLPNIKLRGLMTITAMTGSDEQRRASFSAMRELFETIRKALDSEQFDSLSMGMSADWPLAVEQGANLLRIGTAIFGPRPS